METANPLARPRRPVHVVQRHIPTGKLFASNFNGTHHAYWSDTKWPEASQRGLFRVSQDLVDKWNRQQPGVWEYTLADGPAPDGRTVEISQLPEAAQLIPQRPVHYEAHHRATGRTYTGDFNGSHHGFWSEDHWQYTPPTTLIAIAEKAVQDWNRQSHTSGLVYTLKQGPAPLIEKADKETAIERPVHFVRKSRLTGATEAVDFDGHHRGILSASVWRTRPRDQVVRVAQAVVDEWNARAQDRDEWEYSLGKGPAPAPAPKAPIPRVAEPIAVVPIEFNLHFLKQRIGAALQNLGWTAIAGTAVAMKGYETAVGIKEAHVYVEDWTVAESKVVLRGDYQSEGRNVLAATFISIPKGADDETIAQLCADWAEKADKMVDESFARNLYLGREDPLEEEASQPPKFRRPSLR